MCMKCGCSIPNDKKSVVMNLPNGSLGVNHYSTSKVKETKWL